MKDLEVGLLADFYGELLTPKSREILDKFYNGDMSLGEIAKDLNITRQGVRDYLTRAQKTLQDYEDKLHIAKRFYNIKDKITEYKQELSQNQKDVQTDTLKESVTAFLDKLLIIIE